MGWSLSIDIRNTIKMTLFGNKYSLKSNYNLDSEYKIIIQN